MPRRKFDPLRYHPPRGEWETKIDEGPPGWVAGSSSLTRRDKGWLPPEALVGLRGGGREHIMFTESPRGRMSPARWGAFKRSIKTRGVQNPVMVVIEKDGETKLWEGNHRVRAAIAAGVDLIPVEISYMGNSQRLGLFVDPETV